MHKKTFLKRAVLWVAGIMAAGYLYPAPRCLIPVKGANHTDWHRQSFWHFPWGESITHKGIDIFAPTGTPVISSTSGFVLSAKEWGRGGNVVFVLGPKWRIYYYAHLQSIDTHSFAWVRRGQQVGKVGTTGNAAGRPPHLHYSIISPIPYIWLWDKKAIHGWKKIFYLDPNEYLQ